MVAVTAQFLSQSCHVDVNGAFCHYHVFRPHAVEDVLSRKHLSAIGQQQPEYLQFRLRQLQRFVIGCGRHSLHVDFQPLVGQHRDIWLCCPGEHRFDTGHQFAHGKRLRDVVVGSEVEALQHVVLRVLSRQKNNRHPPA